MKADIGRKVVIEASMKRAAVSDGPQLVIDSEFKKLIPPISDQELELLEASILRFGCLDPLVVWDQGSKLILLDGHNRFSLCEKHGKPHRLTKLKFEDRLAARIWMRRHQLGRRNLTDELRRYTIGELYNDEKLAHGRPAKENPLKDGSKKGSSDEPLISGDTASRIAEEQNVSRHSVINAGKFAESVDAIGEKAPELKAAILAGEVTASAADLEALADAPKRKVESVAKKVAKGDTKAIKQAVREPGDDTDAIKAQQAKRRNSGKEVISPKERSDAKKAFGVVTRFIDKLKRHDELRLHLSAIAAVLEGKA